MRVLVSSILEHVERSFTVVALIRGQQRYAQNNLCLSLFGIVADFPSCIPSKALELGVCDIGISEAGCRIALQISSRELDHVL